MTSMPYGVLQLITSWKLAVPCDFAAQASSTSVELSQRRIAKMHDRQPIRILSKHTNAIRQSSTVYLSRTPRPVLFGRLDADGLLYRHSLPRSQLSLYIHPDLPNAACAGLKSGVTTPNASCPKGWLLQPTRTLVIVLSYKGSRSSQNAV